MRRERKMSQAVFARELSKTQGIVSKWEKGKATPRASDLPRMAEVLGCSIDDLFREDKE